MKAPELETALRRIEELEAEVEKLGKLVDRDVLIPAILNRRGIENRLAPLLEEAFHASDKRREQPSVRRICVAYCDLDHFKEVNDFYGHKSGDEVLLSFAGLVHRRVRKMDLVGRLGGDEFIVVFLNSDYEEANVKMRLITDEFKAQKFSFDPDVGMTFSFGIACAQEFQEMSVLISAAELRMRGAKGDKAR